MRKIVLHDWDIGFNKVGLTNLLQKELKYSLRETKSVTDVVLDRRSLVIEVADDQVDQLALKLSGLGAKFSVGESTHLDRM